MAHKHYIYKIFKNSYTHLSSLLIKKIIEIFSDERTRIKEGIHVILRTTFGLCSTGES